MIPYTHGEHDFSMILGERFFELRKIEYTFTLVEPNYEKRKRLEQVLKGQLMLSDYSKLIDSHDKEGYWWAKCDSVKVDDLHEKSQLRIAITFIARPFFITDSDYSLNLWNDCWYPDKYEQLLSYKVSGEKNIHLWNGFDKSISPMLITDTENLQVVYLGQRFVLKKGTNEFFNFELLKGLNELTIIGEGTIRFRLLGEVMI